MAEEGYHPAATNCTIGTKQELFATSGAQVAMLLAHCPIKNTKLAIAMAGR